MFLNYCLLGKFGNVKKLAFSGRKTAKFSNTIIKCFWRAPEAIGLHKGSQVTVTVDGQS